MMDLKQKLDALPHLRVNHLRDLYAEVFGEPTRANNRGWLVKRLSWKLQSEALGSLSERALARAKELANEADLRTTPPSRYATVPTASDRDPRLPAPGSVLTRGYKGTEHHVEVLANSFIWNGQTYPTLSKVAKAITGSHLNGYAFFGLIKGKSQ